VTFRDWYRKATDPAASASDETFEERGIFWVIRRFVRYSIRRKYGIFWISLFYPIWSLHTFKITKARVHEGAIADESRPLEERWIERDKEPVEVSSLLWQIPRPIVLSGVEFKDRLTADLGIRIILQVIVPEIPVFTFEGKFFSHIEGMIQSAIVDYCRTEYTLQEFISKKPAGSGSDFFARVLSQLNVSGQNRPQGMIERFGIQIINGWIEVIEPNDTEIIEALRAREIKSLKGDGIIAEAEKAATAAIATAHGVAEALRIEGEGKADALWSVEETATAILQHRVSVAGEAIALGDLEVKRLGALRESGVTTYVDKGARSSVIVDAGNRTAPQQPPVPTQVANQPAPPRERPNTKRQGKQNKQKGRGGGTPPATP
jgi:hypothetical protein